MCLLGVMVRVFVGGDGTTYETIVHYVCSCTACQSITCVCVFLDKELFRLRKRTRQQKQ